LEKGGEKKTTEVEIDVIDSGKELGLWDVGRSHHSSECETSSAARSTVWEERGV